MLNRISAALFATLPEMCIRDSERSVLSVAPDFMKLISTKETDLSFCFTHRSAPFSHKLSLNKEQQKRFLYYINKITSAEGFAHDITEYAAFMELMVMLNTLFIRSAEQTAVSYTHLDVYKRQQLRRTQEHP